MTAKEKAEKNLYNVDRVEQLGAKIVAKLVERKPVTKEEEEFWVRCYVAMLATGINQDIRIRWAGLPRSIAVARAERERFIRERDAALAAAAVRSEDKKAQLAKLRAAAAEEARWAPYRGHLGKFKAYQSKDPLEQLKALRGGRK